MRIVVHHETHGDRLSRGHLQLIEVGGARRDIPLRHFRVDEQHKENRPGRDIVQNIGVHKDCPTTGRLASARCGPSFRWSQTTLPGAE
jgi:hypothetical protein